MRRHTFVDGVAYDAQYHTPALSAYRGNPFIEALPPSLERAAAREAMTFYPPYDERDRQAASIDREDMAGLLKTVRHPVGLHVEMYARISRLIRSGYLARNPVRPFFQSHIDQRERAVVVEGSTRAPIISSYPLERGPRPSAAGMTFLGMSGVGKTVAVEMCLHLFPQLLVHREYHGTPLPLTQIVWMRLDVPPDGSILSLAERFFTAVDHMHEAMGAPTRYRAEYMTTRTKIQSAIHSMGRLASQHGLGVLVLDEVQDLNPRGSRAILSFLVQLVNSVGVPVILIGDLAALPVLGEQFRQARRGSSEGDMILSRAQPGEKWRAFCDVLWRYQYTKEHTPMTKAHVDALFEVSAGVTDYMVLAYKLAQQRAISTGAEVVTPSMIRSIRDSLSQAQPVLDALRRGDDLTLARFRDVTLPRGLRSIPFLSGDREPPAPRVETEPVIARHAGAAADAAAPDEEHSGEASLPVSSVVASETAIGEVSSTVKPARRGRSVKPKAARTVVDSPSTGQSSARVENEFASIVRVARKRGESTHVALTAHCAMGDTLWARIIECESAGLGTPNDLVK